VGRILENLVFENNILVICLSPLTVLSVIFSSDQTFFYLNAFVRIRKFTYKIQNLKNKNNDPTIVKGLV
jgi:hypothetical protein